MPKVTKPVPAVEAPKTQHSEKKYGTRYPWAAWFKKKTFTLRKGVDYMYKTHTMAQQVRNCANRKEFQLVVGIEIAEDDQSLTVTVFGKKD